MRPRTLRYKVKHVNGVYAVNNATLKRRISELGGVTVAAKELGVTRQCLYLWLKRGVSKYGLLLIDKAIKDKRGRQVKP